MSQITLLDGGMGQEIAKRAGDVDSPLWSMKAMMEQPGLVEKVHAEYFAAGATIATTNTYPVHHDRLDPKGLGDKFASLLESGLVEAETARSAHGSGRIAGAIGPLGASYRPDICPPVEVAAPLYGEVAAILASRVDLLICETVSSVVQAEGALAGAMTAGKPVWLAVSVSDDDGTVLRSGEPVGDLAAVVAKYKPAAVLANCSVPEVMQDALAIIRGFGLPFGAYANGFRRISAAFLKDAPSVDVLEARNDLGPAEYADFALHWVGMGATIVGGCCETGPAHIAEIARRLERSGFEIV
jgi:S-methylmethionine-dependent homocysteine/selenocysteine methylase